MIIEGALVLVAGARRTVERRRGRHPGLCVDEAFSQLWSGRFRVVEPILASEGEQQRSEPPRNETDTERDEREGIERREAARALTVFLDTMAMYAVRESPFLLDDRYADGRDDEAAQLVRDVNAVAARARALASDHVWRQFVDLLDDLGARRL